MRGGEGSRAGGGVPWDVRAGVPWGASHLGPLELEDHANRRPSETVEGIKGFDRHIGHVIPHDDL